MAYNLRKRAEKNVQRVSRVIYDDPTLVPTRKMSFTVSQWKKVSQNGEGIQEFGKWTNTTWDMDIYRMILFGLNLELMEPIW